MMRSNQWAQIVKQTISCLLLFILSLATVATLLSRLDPFRELEQLHEKWDYWLEHQDEYDTVFIGSSRTYRGVMPKLFDEVTAAAGVPTRSFNFGIDGMISPEDAYVADYVLRKPPRKLRWVFLEVAKFEGNFENRDPRNVRTRHWHDWQRSWLCIRSTLWPRGKKVGWSKWFRPDDDQPWPADTAWTHLELFGSRTLNLGRGTAALDQIFVPKAAKSEILGPARDGFFPYPAEAGLKGSELARYEQSLAQRQEVPAKLSQLKPHHQEAVDAVLTHARKLGARPVLFVAPSVGESRLRPAEREGIPLFDFYDVNAYPELFAPEVRVDMQHLNARGAEIFTRELAERFTQFATGKAAALGQTSK
jgi:hypothetical protein